MSICRFAKEIPLPKIFLISCGKDALSPLSVDFAHWLEENGAEYVFKFYDKKDHPKLSHVFDVAFPHYEESQQAISEMLDFSKKHEKSARSQIGRFRIPHAYTAKAGRAFIFSSLRLRPQGRGGTPFH